MKIPDFRKYIFSYALIISVFCFLGAILWILIWSFGTDIEISDRYLFSYSDFIIYSFWGSVGSLFCLILETLLRELVIKKYFPNLKLPINIKIPEIVSNIYAFIFFWILRFSIAIAILFLSLVIFIR